MPLINSTSPSAFKANLKTEMAAAKPKRQALAIAFDVQRRAHKAGGGAASPPFYARAEAKGLEHAGMIHSPVSGRTDKLPMSVKSGAYVVPADAVSAIGQGNSLAGANGLNKLLRMGPYGAGAAPLPKGTAPKMGALKQPKFANGGDVSDDGQPTEIVAAGGEFVVPPEAVAELGNGDIKKGHDLLDAMVMHIRKKNIKTLKRLPRPKKN